MKISETIVWLIFLMPLISFVFISLIIRPFFNRYSGISGYLAVISIGASFLLSLCCLISLIKTPEGLDFEPHKWLEIADLTINLTALVDPLTVIMLIVVTGVSLMVQIYSMGYMEGDPGYSRYFAYMSLFTASMIGLVMAGNIIQLYVFWELVGLCSYLLIGFWFSRPAAASAAKKAFIITRIGDFGLLLAILYLAYNSTPFTENGLNPLEIADIYKAVAIPGLLAGSVVTWICVGIFTGAVGKSGQFPLHTWLPDAMECPTPVSALIHAATMVTAGVFLVARFFPLFQASEVALGIVVIVGGFTAIFAASMGLVMNDIKRVLAYSTVSQLGYMMLALGTGAYGPAVFHLFTHAFFKALLFLGSGSVNHATGTFDIRYMGGLRRVMPWTYVTFIIGSLSLAGIFPLAGFWSKDEILTHVFKSSELMDQVVFWLAFITVGMTSFYMFRTVFLVFGGQFRGGAEKDPDQLDENKVNLHESPSLMILPILILTIPSIIVGFVVNPVIDIGIVPEHWFSHFLHAEYQKFNLVMAICSGLVALFGILLAYLIYSARIFTPDKSSIYLKPIHTVLINKYYLDELYEKYITDRFTYRLLAASLDWIDKYLIDGMVQVVDYSGRNIGKGLAHLQSGQVQGYGAVISLGVLVIFFSFLGLR